MPSTLLYALVPQKPSDAGYLNNWTDVVGMKTAAHPDGRLLDMVVRQVRSADDMTLMLVEMFANGVQIRQWAAMVMRGADPTEWVLPSEVAEVTKLLLTAFDAMVGGNQFALDAWHVVGIQHVPADRWLEIKAWQITQGAISRGIDHALVGMKVTNGNLVGVYDLNAKPVTLDKTVWGDI